MLIALILFTAILDLRHEIAAVPQKLALLRLWLEPDAQSRRELGTIYDFLRGADRALPREASVLLLTSGRDVRHREYTTFHRALYYLTPRPVWWLTPAPSDGTWESRWWASAPLTGEAILSFARDRGVTHLLAFELSDPPGAGRKLAELPGGALFTFQTDASELPLVAPPAEPARAPWLWPLRLGGAVLVILLLGHLALTAAGYFGLEATRIERAALAWILGAGITSVAMLWLDASGLPLNAQIAILSSLALAGFAIFGWRSASNDAVFVDSGNHKDARSVLLIALLAVCILLVALGALGRPLALWDSWVLWGMRARAIYGENGISPVIYADPSRTVTLPDYPLLVPLLQAWIYGWLGAADDRLAGVVSVMSFVALPALAYGSLRRRGAEPSVALLASTALAALPSLLGLAAGVSAEVIVALFTAVAAVYLIEWLERRSRGALLVAALAAGFLPWVKQEGLVIVAVLSVATLIIGRGARNARLAALAMAGCALLLSGPWYAFVSMYGISGPQLESVSLTGFIANLERLPSIGWRAFRALASTREGWVWPAALLFACCWSPPGGATRPSALLLLVAVVYVFTMAFVYFFSAYVPYQQHMASSFFRLVAEVSPLPLLWLAYHAAPIRPPRLRSSSLPRRHPLGENRFSATCLHWKSRTAMLAAMKASIELDRHAIDRIARAVVSGRRGFGSLVDGWADRIAGLMSNRLAAAGVVEVPSARIDRWQIYSTYDRELIDRLLERAAKHLAARAAASERHGRPPPR